MPSASVLRRLKLSPEVAWYLLSRGYDLPKHPPLHKTPEGGADRKAVFSPDAVDAVITAMKHLVHTQGRWAGQPLAPDPWQVAYFIAPVFGWLKENDQGRWVRVVRTAYLDVPRKNGKSTMSGGLGLYLTGADGEPGAQVVAAAASKTQAGYVFNPIKELAKKSPALAGRFRSLTGKILHPASGSEFVVVAAVGDTQHGANIHGAIIDELHVHKTRDLVDAIETGTGAREQPLVIIITTPDAGKPHTIYSVKRRTVEQLAAGALKDPATYGVVFGLADSADPLKPSNWGKANPGYPISPTHDYMVSAAKKARESPADMANFRRLHSGQRTRQTTAYIDVKRWASNKHLGPVKGLGELDRYAGRAALGGLDLGSTSDLSALCWLIPDQDGDGYEAFWRYWAPEAALEALDRATAGLASKDWVPSGWLTTTPGDVTDYDYIEARIKADADILDVQTVGLDMWNATQLANNLTSAGVPLMKVRQGFVTMSPALKEVQRQVMRRKLRHDGNPITLWCVDNLAVDMDAAGNVKPNKARSADKIDGVSALVNAMSEALGAAAERSAYDDGHDLMVV